MTTPNDESAIAILTDAYMDAGLLMLGDSLGGDAIAIGMRRLRGMIALWQTTGLRLWLNVDTAVPLISGQATYTFMPTGTIDMTRPLRVLQGYYLYSSNNTRRPILPMSWNDYLTLGQAGTQVGNQGPITQYFVDKKATSLNVTFWLCPDDNEVALGEAHVLLQVAAGQPANITESTGFPPEWRNALHWGLADELTSGQPESIIQKCSNKAQMTKTILDGWDVEDAPTQFAPDPRIGHGSGNFK